MYFRRLSSSLEFLLDVLFPFWWLHFLFLLSEVSESIFKQVSALALFLEHLYSNCLTGFFLFYPGLLESSFVGIFSDCEINGLASCY